ncbi:MAG: DsbC family protein [Gammaproteobacteria bacterium]|nr:DsbC family protein [Gammaproteobacteria bacterium]
MNKFKFLLAAGLLSSMTASFAAENADVAKLLKLRLGFGAEVSDPIETPAKGVYQTKFGAKYGYLAGNGRYIIIGDMIDLETQENLTEVARRSVTKEVIDKVDITKLAVYPSSIDETKAVLNIFTDTSCPYCKKLHEEVPDLQKAGIEVRYFPFARGGARGPGYSTLKQVWCGKDKAKTMNIAKEVETGLLPSADCDEAKFVDEAYNLGNQLGVNGTPALFTADGQKIEGYVPSAKLIPMILQ